MSIEAKKVLIGVCVLLATACLMGAGSSPSASAGSSAESPARSPLENSSILIEAFVVEVDLPALADAGVSPIGQRPHAVTVGDILTCLKRGQARVIGGNKIAAHGRSRTGAEMTTTAYFGQEAGAPRRGNISRQTGAKLSAEIEPVTETAVSVQFVFSTSRLPQKPETETTPQIEDWNWSGSAILQLGSPQIVGAAQDGETAVFLLLVANPCD